MERRAFQTPLGEVWLWGEPDAFSGSKPVILVIHGSFTARRTVFFNLQRYHPEAAVLLAQLPGNHCPELSEVSIAAYAAAYDEAMRQVLQSRPLILCGVSTGALVALAMKCEQACPMVLVEPPLRTGKLWALVAGLDGHERFGPWAERFVSAIFGFHPDRIEDRDYTPLLNSLNRRAWVLLGDVPLMPRRSFSELPSLVDEPERALLRAHPFVRIAIAPGVGHNLPQYSAQLIDAALVKVLGEIR